MLQILKAQDTSLLKAFWQVTGIIKDTWPDISVLVKPSACNRHLTYPTAGHKHAIKPTGQS